MSRRSVDKQSKQQLGRTEQGSKKTVMNDMKVWQGEQRGSKGRMPHEVYNEEGNEPVKILEDEAEYFKEWFPKMRIVVTVIGAMRSKKLDMYRQTMLVVDECSTVEWFLSPILLSRGGFQMAFLGDYRQLPAVCSVRRLAESEMDRWLKRGGPIHRLNTQYRMNLNIAKFISTKFYEGTVTSSSVCRQRVLGNAFPHYKKHYPITVVDITTPEKRGGEDSMSYTNDGQTEATLAVMLGLLQVLENNQTVLVLCSYRQQKLDCRVALKGLLELYGDSKLLQVQTIDEAQGGEADVVLLVTTRCNVLCDIGHTSDIRRINVALSRAKSAIIVICDVSTLATDEVWKSLFAQCDINNSVISMDWGGHDISTRYAMARNVTIANKLANPFARSFYVRGGFWAWNAEKFLEECRVQLGVTFNVVSTMEVPEMSQTGMYRGGPSGEYYLLLNHEVDVDALNSLIGRYMSDKPNHWRFIEVYPMGSSHDMTAKLWKESSVVILRGFIYRQTGEELKNAITSFLIGLTVRHVERTASPDTVAILLENAAQASAAVHKNGAMDTYNNQIRFIELWKCLDPYFNATVLKSAKDAGHFF